MERNDVKGKRFVFIVCKYHGSFFYISLLTGLSPSRAEICVWDKRSLCGRVNFRTNYKKKFFFALPTNIFQLVSGRNC